MNTAIARPISIATARIQFTLVTSPIVIFHPKSAAFWLMLSRMIVIKIRPNPNGRAIYGAL